MKHAFKKNGKLIDMVLNFTTCSVEICGHTEIILQVDLREMVPIQNTLVVLGSKASAATIMNNIGLQQTGTVSSKIARKAPISKLHRIS